MAEKTGLSNLISDEYRAMLREMHETQDWGGSGHKRAVEVEEFARDIDAKTVLDYGCGQGRLREELDKRKSGLIVHDYDPAVPGKGDVSWDGKVDPAFVPFDLVVCTDVLEHVEPDRLDTVINHVCRLSGRGTYFLIATREANKCLPDGRNAHLIVQDARWWVDTLCAQGIEDFSRLISWHTDPEERNLRVWIKW